MAGNQDAKDCLRAIHHHADVLLDAYHHHQNRLFDGDDTTSVSKAMLKHHLAWKIDDDDDVVLSRPLTNLFDTVTRSHRISMANAEIGSLWEEMMEQIDYYQEADKKGALRDAEMFQEHAFEAGFRLLDSLKLAIAGYSHYINSGFTEIRDLDLRARKNADMLKQAKTFNDLLESFDFSELERKAGHSSELRRLLRKVIPKSIGLCLSELSYAIGNLRSLLHEVNEQRTKTRLVNSLLAHYERNDEFIPTFDDINSVPEVCNRAQPLLLSSRADLDNPLYEVELSDLARSIESSQARDVEEHEASPVDNAMDIASVEQIPDPIWDAARQVLEVVKQDSQGAFSALKIYDVFDLECGHELWMLALVNTVNSLKAQERRGIHITYTERIDPIFNGNAWVSDVVLSSQPRSAP